MHCDALNGTVTEIRIHGCDVYDSHIKAAGCVVAFDVVYLQSVLRTRSDCRAWRVLATTVITPIRAALSRGVWPTARRLVRRGARG